MIKIVFIVVTLLYGSLNILASIISIIKSKTSLTLSLTMLIGGLLINFSSVPYFKKYPIILLIIGLIIIHIVAIENGFKIHGKLNLNHHLIRLIISISIVILCVLSK